MRDNFSLKNELVTHGPLFPSQFRALELLGLGLLIFSFGTIPSVFPNSSSLGQAAAKYIMVGKTFNLRIVYFHMETTGLDPDSRHADVQICSIAAYYQSAKKSFSQHLIPTCLVDPAATKINKFKVVNGVLFHSGRKPKDALPTKDGLEEFVRFLEEEVEEGGQKVKIVLVAHNNMNFDSVVLLNNMNRLGIPVPRNWAFADTMRMLRIVKARDPMNFSSISLKNCLYVLFKEQIRRTCNAMDKTLDLIRVADKVAQRYFEEASYAALLNANRSHIVTPGCIKVAIEWRHRAQKQ